MSRYTIWIRGPILELMPGLAVLAAEILEDGYVGREIGFDIEDAIIHRKPAPGFQHGEFGLLDGPPINVDIATGSGVATEVDQATFEELWSRTE